MGKSGVFKGIGLKLEGEIRRGIVLSKKKPNIVFITAFCDARKFKDKIMSEEEVTGAAPELSTAVADEILKLSESGNEYIDEEDFDSAIAAWEEALALIPEPQNHYIQSVWLNASIGDAYYLQDDFKTALTFFETTTSNTEENVNSNPFIMLRLGECYLEQGDKEKAKEYLLRAYLLEPDGIFYGEDEKYFKFLSANVDLKAQG